MLIVSCFFSCYGDHRDLHSFPTRRSSDLHAAQALVAPGVPRTPIFPYGWSPPTAGKRSDDGRNRAGKASSDLFPAVGDRKSTRLNSSHPSISYAVFCLKKKKISMKFRQ